MGVWRGPRGAWSSGVHLLCVHHHACPASPSSTLNDNHVTSPWRVECCVPPLGVLGSAPYAALLAVSSAAIAARVGIAAAARICRGHAAGRRLSLVPSDGRGHALGAGPLLAQRGARARHLCTHAHTQPTARLLARDVCTGMLRRRVRAHAIATCGTCRSLSLAVASRRPRGVDVAGEPWGPAGMGRWAHHVAKRAPGMARRRRCWTRAVAPHAAVSLGERGNVGAAGSMHRCTACVAPVNAERSSGSRPVRLRYHSGRFHQRRHRAAS